MASDSAARINEASVIFTAKGKHGKEHRFISRPISKTHPEEDKERPRPGGRSLQDLGTMEDQQTEAYRAGSQAKERGQETACPARHCPIQAEVRACETCTNNHVFMLVDPITGRLAHKSWASWFSTVNISTARKLQGLTTDVSLRLLSGIYPISTAELFTGSYFPRIINAGPGDSFLNCINHRDIMEVSDEPYNPVSNVSGAGITK